MFWRKLYIVAALLSLGGLITLKVQATAVDVHARLLQVAEGIDENVEDLEDGIDDIENEIEDIEDKMEDFGEGIEDMETGVRAVETKVTSLQEEVKTMRNNLEGELQQIGAVQKEILQYTEQQHKMAQELAVMQGNINSTLHTVEDLKLQLTTLARELILTPHSCSELDPSNPSGYYLVNWNRVRVYCDMDRHGCGCGRTQGWMRVANIDMNDPNSQCPEGFRLRSGTSKRMCEVTRVSKGCTSIVFPAHSVQYSRVCGRVKAYQYGSPDGFSPYYNDRSQTIDGIYADGVSITHGWNPRKHIWTFAAAVSEIQHGNRRCPCINSFTGIVPSFIGNDYFCDTGSRVDWQSILYTEDPLWDGQGCGPTSSCCQFNSPPWFCKKLPQPTTDDIELRMCRNEARSNEDIPFEVIELYIQ